MNKLQEHFKDRDFVLVGQPANQFGYQEPKSGESLATYIQENFNPNFTILEKNDVNGSNASDLFKFLKNHKACKGGILGNNVKLAFTKFLVGKDGVPLKRYSGTVMPMNSKLIADIEKALNA